MTERRKIQLKPSDVARDPMRQPVRPGAVRPRPSASHAQDAREARIAPASPEPPPPRRADTTAAVPTRTLSTAAVTTPAAITSQEGMRLSKWLAEQGMASRREADEWIEAGWVKVDGVPAVLGQRIHPESQTVVIDDIARTEQATRVTILLHKPIGFVSGQAEDGHAPAVTLITARSRWPEDRAPTRFHSGQLRHLAPAGRLDIDSTGLLVLTQDGRIAKRLIGDETRVEKEYLVRVQLMRPGPLPERSLALLNHGLSLDDKPLKPAKVSWANEDQLRFVLREGRKRQIRRMCEVVGLKVVALKRVRIGRVALGKLPPGQWRYLRDDEGF